MQHESSPRSSPPDRYRSLSRLLKMWQSRRSKGNLVLRLLAFPVRKVSSWLGRYVAYTPAERACASQERIPFAGDIPAMRRRAFVHWLKFATPRLAKETVENLIYTPKGRGWVDGTLYECFSIDRKPAAIDLIRAPKQDGIEVIPQGTILQVEHPETYGDWVGEILVTLARALPITEPPLLLPQFLLEKSYAQRDLAQLGIEARGVERPLRIERATVLHKRHPFHHLVPEDVAAYRQAFSIVPPSPRPGSILYLSRSGERSELRDRRYPSETVAQVLSELGATVVRTCQTSQADYIALAESAETVVADHGAAIYNLFYWQTKNLIELVSGDWWNECFLPFGKSVGVSKHVLLVVDNLDGEAIRQRVRAEIQALQSQEPTGERLENRR